MIDKHYRSDLAILEASSWAKRNRPRMRCSQTLTVPSWGAAS